MSPPPDSVDSSVVTTPGATGAGPSVLRVRVVGTVAAAALLAAAAVSTTWFLGAAAAVLAGVVVHRTITLASDLTRERTLSVRLDEALAQVTRQRDQLEAQREELQRLARHDSVTGLGNRALLQHRGEELGPRLADAALLLLDLDGFKEVNDTLGHSLGDRLLRYVGEQLSRSVRVHDTVARLGGDEFVVLLPDVSGWNAAQTADRILDGVRKPFTLAGQAIQIRGSVGIAYGSASATLDELLQKADVAMYAAKAAGRDRSCEFHESMNVDTAERFRFDAEIRQGLTRGDFKVHYQPIVEARSGRVVSLEALVRWEHPDRGVLPPSEFLAATQRSGLIVELGQFVLRTACEQTAQWRRKWPWLTVAVNASQRELLDPEFAAQVAGVLATTGLPAGALYVEVTETVLAAEEQIEEVLQPLTAMGVRCSLDDFGTGHSSLSRLGRLAVDRVKIDRSFVMDVTGEHSPGAPLLASIIGLAHSLGLGVVAEGVETRDQADFLASHGCEELQGFYFSRPIPPGQIPTTVAAGLPTERQEGLTGVLAPVGP